MVFARDASPCLNNKVASQLPGNTPPFWKNESGQKISFDELPLESVQCRSRPVLECIMAVSNEEGHTTWLSVNALSALSENGSVRRVLLTLTDIHAERTLHNEVKHLQFATR